jgi:sec-independent protein translocase protein TatA
MGTTEIVFVLFIYLLLFGAKGIPSLARSMGEGIRYFRGATDEIQREILKSSNEIKTDFRDVKNSMMQTPSSTVKEKAASAGKTNSETTSEASKAEGGKTD